MSTDVSLAAGNSSPASSFQSWGGSSSSAFPEIIHPQFARQEARATTWFRLVRAGLLALLSSMLTLHPVVAQVISEFLTQNSGLFADEDGDTPDWIEIHNPTGQPVNLLNWSLTDTKTNLVKWRFPSTNLAAGGFLVVFASGKDRRQPGAPLHTNFKLDSDGEYLGLVASDGSSVISSFDPVYPPQLPNISFGIGTSAGEVTLLSPNAPARSWVPTNDQLGTNWIAPGYDDSSWTPAVNGVGYETSPAEYADLIGTSVQAEMASNNSCYVRWLFVIEDRAALSQWRLLMQYDDGFIAYLNGVEIARRNAPDNPAWNSAATANHPDADAVIPEEFSLTPLEDLIVQGTNLLAVQGLNISTSSSDFLIRAAIAAQRSTGVNLTPVYFTAPTPGSPNSGGTEDLGPIIRDVAHEPARPTAGAPLTVTARLTQSFQAIALVTLHYRVMFGEERLLPMRDDGTQQDGAAADGTFGAVIPAGIAQPGELIRYFITSTDAAGKASRLPLFLDARDSAESFGAVLADPAVESRLPVVWWYTQNPGQAETQTGTRGGLFYQGEYYDNVLFSLHGQSSSGFPKHSFNVDFARDHRFRYGTNSSRVKDIKLLTNWGDKSRTRNSLAYQMIEEAGSAGHFAFPVRVQLNGQFHAILDLMEDADDRWLERLGRDPEGALYKMYNGMGSASGNEKKTRKTEDSSDLQTLIDNLSESRPLATRALYAYDHLDLPQVISYFVGLALISSQDHGHKNFYLYRDTPQTGEWAIFPWDVDLSWGRNWTDSGGYFTDTLYQTNSLTFYDPAQQNKSDNRLYNLIFSHPDFQTMYLRRLRSVMDTLLQSPSTPAFALHLEARLREMLDQMDPPDVATSDADLDYTKWGSWGNRNATRAEAQRIIDIHLPGRRNFLFHSPAAVLGGQGILEPQPTNASLLFGSIDFNPSSGDQQEEFVELLNPSVTALDLTGWRLEGGIEFAFKPGTVLPQGGRLYLSPHPAAFRARSTAPRGGQGLYVQGNYHGQLSARGELLRLRDASGRIAAETNYLGNPTLAQQFLRVTELMYHPADAPADSPFSDEDFEFIELKNLGASPLSLEGVQWTRGITFRFNGSAITRLEPGAYVLIVKNPEAFVSRYGTRLPVAGAYLGSLQNAGETLRLEDGTGEVISDFAYESSWYPSTDGGGQSLEAVGNTPSPNAPGQWRPSSQPGGTPGTESSQGMVLRVTAVQSGRLILSVRAEAGRRYTIWHRSNLEAGPWESGSSIVASDQATDLALEIDVPLDGHPHFYRVGRD